VTTVPEHEHAQRRLAGQQWCHRFGRVARKLLQGRLLFQARHRGLDPSSRLLRAHANIDEKPPPVSGDGSDESTRPSRLRTGENAMGILVQSGTSLLIQYYAPLTQAVSVKYRREFRTRDLLPVSRTASNRA
jgi:hypothetical protein